MYSGLLKTEGKHPAVLEARPRKACELHYCTQAGCIYLAAPVRSRELTHIRMIKLATKYRRWHPVKVQQEVNGFSALRTATDGIAGTGSST